MQSPDGADRKGRTYTRDRTDMIIHLPTGKKFHNRKEAKIYFGTAYYYKMEREKRDLMFTNYIQSATNEYEDTIKAPAKQDK